MEGQAIEQRPLRPWAAIYHHDGQNYLSNLLYEEHVLRLTHVLTKIGAMLRTLPLRETLPASLIHTPVLWKKPKPGFREEEVLDSSTPTQLHVSTGLQENNSDSMYRVIIKIESETELD